MKKREVYGNEEDVAMNRIKEVLIEADISQTELTKRLGKGFNMVNLYAPNRVPRLYPYYTG